MEKSNCFLKMQTCFPSCFVTHYTLVTKIYGRFKYDDIINESKEIRGINKFVYMHMFFFSQNARSAQMFHAALYF